MPDPIHVAPTLNPSLEPDAPTVPPSATGSFPAAAANPADGSRPTGLGRYSILHSHAKGGLGEVFVARDEELNRSVAVKRIQPQFLANAACKRRFLVEAEITARLEHPGIVPVYGLVQDENGDPCYAMRFIEGESLHDAIKRFHGERGCVSAPSMASDDQDQLGDKLGALTRPRSPGFDSLAFRNLLQRFITVCNTLAYAHSRGVIHRDLKPQNVMLGKYGETLVVDWGLAKSFDRSQTPSATEDFDESTVTPTTSGTDSATQLGQAIGTPQYMSPEQAAGRWDVMGPAADVYSLGATLYVLLTGRPAFTEPNVGILLFAVQQGEFLPPRQVNPAVPRALAAICLKAMARKPDDRYANALDLAHDVEHWLADEPVSCCRESLPIRVGRFARKHRTLVTSAAAVLTVATIGSIVGLVVVGGLNSRLETAHSNLDSAYGDLVQKNAALETATASEKTERERAEKTLEFFVAALRRPDPSQDGKKLTVYELLAQSVKAVDANATLDPKSRWALLNAIGRTYHGLGEYPEAITAYEVACRLAEETLGDDHPDTLTARNNLAMAYQDAGKLDLAISPLERTLKACEAKLGDEHPDTLTSRNNLAMAYMDAGKLDLAIPLLERTLKDSEAKLGDDHPHTLASRNNLASAYQAAGELDLAIPLYERTLKASEAKLGDEHPDTLASRNNLASAYQAAGKRDLAIPLLERTLKASEAKLGDEHPNTLSTRSSLATAYGVAGKLDLAIPLLERTLKASEAKLGDEHPSTLNFRSNLASAYQAAGKLDLAIPLLERTLKALKAKLGDEHPDTLHTMNNLAVAYWRAKQLDKSIPLFEQALTAQRKKLGERHPDTLRTLANLGVNYRDAGRLAEAIPLLEQADQASRKHPSLRWVRANLLNCYVQAGQTAKAAVLAKEQLAEARNNLPAGSPQLAGLLAQTGLTLLMDKAWSDAEPILRESLAIRDKIEPDAWTTFNTKSMLGAAILGQARSASKAEQDAEAKAKFAEAEALLLQGYEGLKRHTEKAPAANAPGAPITTRLTETLERLVQLYDALGKPDVAAKWRAQLPAEVRIREGLERHHAWPFLWGWPRF